VDPHSPPADGKLPTPFRYTNSDANQDEVEGADLGAITAELDCYAVAAIRVLVIAYHFPPAGGGGVQRAQKTVRYLPDFGVDPIVLAGPGTGRGRWEPSDDSLVENVSSESAVYRPDGEPPPGFGDGRAYRLLGVPSPFSRWWRRSILALGERIDEFEDIEAIFVTAPPYHSIGPAVTLAKRMGVPITVDLRDPWVLDEGRLFPSAVHRRWAFHQMRRELRRASCVVMNCDAAGNAMREWISDGPRIEVIPNGFDAADFAGVVRQKQSRMRIVHTGYLHTGAGFDQRARTRRRTLLGASIVPVDFLGRSHYYLIRALGQLLRLHPELADRLELVLAGVLSEADRRVVEEANLRIPVSMPGYIDHASAIQLIVDASVLFLPLYGLPPGYRARIVPGKTYEYLASGSPILGALPEGDARDLILAHQAGIVVEPSDVHSMTNALHSLVVGDVGRRPIGAVDDRFDRHILTGRIAEVLHASRK